LVGLRGGELRARIAAVLDAVGLSDRARDAVRKYSGGMKRRLNLAIGMLHQPRLLLLDEPTAGIDPQARLNVLEVVRSVARADTIVLYTTHYLEEAQNLCDRIGIMDHGRILAEGSLAEIERIAGEGEILAIRGRFTADGIKTLLGDDPRVRMIAIEDGHAVMDVGRERGEAAALLGRIIGQGVALDDIAIQPPSLQSLFLKLTGRELRD
jgi:ABC-2 type transport system ATP-binding protein